MHSIFRVIAAAFPLLLAPATHGAPDQWNSFNACKDGLDLEDAGRSYQYRLFAEGGTSDGTFTGITTVPEWLPILVALDRATDGLWNATQSTLPDHYGPGLHYFDTDLRTTRMLEVGSGEPDGISLDCAGTAAFSDTAAWVATSSAPGTQLAFTHVAFRVTAATGNMKVWAVLIDASSPPTIALVDAIRLDTLSGKTASQPAWEDVKISLEMLLHPGLGGGITRTYIAGSPHSAFRSSIDDLWSEPQALPEEPPIETEEQRADINKDGAVGGPDFTLLAAHWGNVGIEH